MTIRRYRKDPRGRDERADDEEVLRRFEAGELLRVDRVVEREAIEHVERRYRSRRELVATLGKELGVLRRAHGLTQEQVACAVGTNKSNISRLESGRDGGLTVERLVAVEDAIRSLAGRTVVSAGERELIHVEPLDRFRNATDCLEVA